MLHQLAHARVHRLVGRRLARFLERRERLGGVAAVLQQVVASQEEVADAFRGIAIGAHAAAPALAASRSRSPRTAASASDTVRS